MEWKGKQSVSRNKDTKLDSSSLHRRDTQCSQLHRQTAETQRLAVTSRVEALLLLISLAKDTIQKERKNSQDCAFQHFVLFPESQERGKLELLTQRRFSENTKRLKIE